MCCVASRRPTVEEKRRVGPCSLSLSLCGRRAPLLQARIRAGKQKAAQSPVRAVRILHRYHFSSQLQRMSVLCKVSATGEGAIVPGRYCLTKGSPEAVRALLRPGAEPAWYQATYRQLAERGMRVLALAYKRCGDGDAPGGANGGAELSRAEVESKLWFGGFICFECKTRADSVRGRCLAPTEASRRF